MTLALGTYQVTLALRVLAIASVVGGIAVFCGHGGRRVTGAGLYCFALGIVNGSGAWYWAAIPPTVTSRESILFVAVGIYASTVVTYLAFWRRSIPDSAKTVDSLPPIPVSLARGASVVGVVIFVLGAASELAFGTLGQSMTEVGMIILAAALVLSGSMRVLGSPLRTLVIAGVLLAFYLFVFTGYGRLRLAALALIILLIAQSRTLIRVKAFVVLALFPVMLVFGAIGESRLNAKAIDPTAEASVSGLGSLVNPLATFAQFVGRDFESGLGSTLFAPFVVLVPRAVWSGKPEQFGAVVVRELRPDMVSTNLSMPCLAQCEWFYNFSWVGFLLAIPVLGWIVRWLDITLARSATVPITQWHQFLALVLIATLVGSFGDLAWGGTATWSARNAQRVLVLTPLLAWAYLVHRPRRESARN